MKRPGKIAACLAGALVLNASLHAASPAASHAPAAVKAPAGNPPSDNPYTTVAVRNIFGLNPPAPPTPVDPPEKNLPKITPTGIMGVFGHWQVLFKVTPVAKGGPPAKDEFYILSEGQRQDDITVVKIDERNSLVTFDNHSITQELPLAAAASAGGGAAAASWSGGAGGVNPGMAAGAGGGGPGGPGGFTQFGGGPGGNNGGRPNSNPGFNGGGPSGANGAGGGMDFNTPVQGRVYQPEASGMTPDEVQQVVAINHAKALLNNSISAPVFPPSTYDIQAGITPDPADPGSGQNGGSPTR
jgi:hypothetical protein